MRRWIFGAMALIPFLAAGEWAAGGPVLLYNATPSITTGWYRWAPGHLDHDDVVAFDSAILPAAHQAQLPPRLMKHVGASAGEQICRRADNLVIAGQRYPLRRPALAFLADGVCTTLPSGMILPIGTHPDSYDGRYFGPVPESQVRRVKGVVVD
jgi:type IV secretory pathway protease TraF